MNETAIKKERKELRCKVRDRDKQGSECEVKIE